MKKKLLIALCLFAAFLLLIILIKTVDVRFVTETRKDIGLGGFNIWFHDLTDTNMNWYKFTQLMGFLALGAGGVFAVLGLIQLIKRKNLLKVDRPLLLLGAMYIVMGILYVVFEFVAVSYRPIIMPDKIEAEPSFPSSHTMLVIVIFGGIALILRYYIKDRMLKISLQALCILLQAITVFGRLASGVHWFTDILGGVLISLALLFGYSAALEVVDRKGAFRGSERSASAEDSDVQDD